MSIEKIVRILNAVCKKKIVEIYYEMGFPIKSKDFSEETRKKYHIPVDGDFIIGYLYMRLPDCEMIADGKVLDKIPKNLRALSELEANFLGSMLIMPDPLVEKLIMKKARVKDIERAYGVDREFVKFRLFTYYLRNIYQRDI